METLNYIKYTSVKGHPMVEFHFNEDFPSLMIRNNYKKSLKYLSPNCVQIPYNKYYDFYDINRDIMGEYCNITVSDNSIEKFYEARPSGKCSTNLTPKFIFDAINKCEDIIVIEPNRGNKFCNSLGMTFPDFERYLYHEDQDEPWLPEEILAWENALNHFKNSWAEEYLTRIINKQKKWINDQNITENHIAELKQFIENTESKIQNEINKHFSELQNYQKTLPEYNLDCGFTCIQSSNEDINSTIDILIHKGIRNNRNLNVHLPDTYMSCSQSYQLLNKLKELSDESYIQELFIKTYLD